MSDLHQSVYQIQWQTVNELKALIHLLSENKDNVYIKRIQELEAELRRLKKSKRYGLVWEDKPEGVVERCKNELPVLVEDNSKQIIEWWDDLTHILIEWDNYHALSVLAYTHEKKVDVIYIDPPYNTGATDWKYNNDYVDSNDTFRHSKWLSMMNNRLLIAKKLLKSEWSLILAIDENEVATITLLLQELFPDFEITCVTVIHNPSWVQWKNFSRNNEFALFVYPKWDKKISLCERNIEDADVRPLRDVSKGNHLRIDAKNCFYPIFIKDGNVIGFGDVCDDNFHPSGVNIERIDWVIEVYPIDPQWYERKWVFARQTVESIKSELRPEWNNKRKAWDIIRTKVAFNYKTVWDDWKYNANIYGTQLLGKVLWVPFPFPKSLYLVKECISAIIHNKQNAVILDFFAWSGTTWHAVLELNKEDGWKRQFILCTNNENKIAEEVTYPRIHNVIKGYADVEGIPANLRYYRTDFIWVDKSIDDLRGKFMGRCTEMLQVRENTFLHFPVSKNGSKWGWEWESEYFRVFQNSEKLLIVMYHPYEIETFKKWFEFLRKKEQVLENANSAIHKEIVVYIFSMGWEIFEEELTHLSDRIRIETIPDEVLETYKKVFGF